MEVHQLLGIPCSSGGPSFFHLIFAQIKLDLESSKAFLTKAPKHAAENYGQKLNLSESHKVKIVSH